ncbi:MerR family transcriptional regulator [Myxococcota bacterium]|nr:MerR family transcriptional regulator [Myxococcota bacterium]
MPEPTNERPDESELPAGEAAAAAEEPTYSLGAVCRLTGLSEHVLRAWERRYGAVRPLRTPGGTRRYREADVTRLQRLRSALAAGHSIGEVARLDDAELTRRAALTPRKATPPPLAPILAAIEQLDGDEVERLLGAQLSALGPSRFVRGVGAPLLVEVGDRWHAGRLSIASEHLASSILRNLLGACLRRPAAAVHAPPVLFTTPPGERHELGTLMAAVTTVDVCGHPVFFGSDLPVSDVAEAVASIGAAAVALGVCHRNGADLSAILVQMRTAIPGAVELWIGGPGSDALTLPAGAARIADLDELERKVALLAVRGTPG